MILNVHFIHPLIVGGQTMTDWSSAKNSGQVNAQCTLEDRGPLGVVVRFRGGATAHDIEVPRSNISQITRMADEKEKKK